MNMPNQLKKDKLYCFICHRELSEDMYVLVLGTDDEMICVCREHMEGLLPSDDSSMMKSLGDWSGLPGFQP